MGQNESKPRFDNVAGPVEQIRLDVKNGKITANDVEKYQGILQQYSRGLGPNQSIRLKKLIETTSKELDALKEEANLDSAAVLTSSFRRGSAKRGTKEKTKSVTEIVNAVEDIRNQIKGGRVQNAEQVQADLASFSRQLSSKKGKKQEIDRAQKLISSTSQELFRQQQSADSVSVRSSTNSQPRKSENSASKKSESANLLTRKSEKRQSSSKEPEARKEIYSVVDKSTTTLDDIANKFDNLKSDLTVVESSKDRSRLRFLAKSVETLMTDLQMVNVRNHTINEQKKELLEKDLQCLYQQIEKTKRHISTEKNITYLVELEKKQKKGRCLEELEELKTTLKNIGTNLTQDNYQTEKENFILYKNKLDSIDDMDEKVVLKKAEISDILLNLEHTFTQLEMEDRLNQAEWRHCQYKIDLNKFNHTTEHDAYKKHREYLIQLREYVNRVQETSQKVDEKKKYIFYNIDNNIAALDKKAEENKKKEKTDKETASPNDLLTACNEVPTSCSPQELKILLPLLIQARNIIDQKLNVLQNQVEREDYDNIVVRIKEKEVQPDVNNLIYAIDNVQAEVANLPSRENAKIILLDEDIIDKKPEDVRVLEITKGPEAIAGNQEKAQLSKRRSTTDDILNDIMSISSRINELEDKIKNCSQSTQGYESIRNSLLEHREYLRRLNLSPNRTNVYKSKEQIMSQIDRLLVKIEELKKHQYNDSASEEEKRFNQDLRKLKEKVSRYSGTYKNVLYQYIEDDLDRHLKEVDEIFKDPDVALKVKRDIEKNKIILEQKSHKDHRYSGVEPDTGASNDDEWTEIKRNVESVKTELSQRSLTKEELDQLDAKLTLTVLALDNVKDERYSNEKAKLYQEIHYYFAQIQELMIVSKSPSVISEDLQEQQIAKILGTIERGLEKTKADILTFVGTETSPEFLRLDEILVRDTIRLDDLNIDKTSKLYPAKLKLMKEIHNYSDTLDQRINQTEEIEKLEKHVKVMFMKIDSFNGYCGDPEYQSLDEELIKLKVSLGKLNVNLELIDRREACTRDVDICMKKLNESAKTRTGRLEGTLV